MVKAPIQAGCLFLTIHREDWPLEECVTYATRQNPRRLYLFVSKVLGKHWPVRPSTMHAVHRQLAAKIRALPGPVLIIGMAETATALGRGVAEELAVLAGRSDILYVQTTRCRLSRPLAFAFDESHSHAPDHAVYLPEPELEPLFRTARALVLVDDEISTGRTMTELADAYLRINPQVEQIALVSITCWLNAAQRFAMKALLARPLEFPALIEGEFSFEADLAFPPPDLPLAAVRSATPQDGIVADPARTGLIAGQSPMPPPPDVPYGRPLTLIGTGEYAYIPFRIALALEELGHDVRFQATTRSPILLGDAIASRVEFPDPYGDGIPNYLYNFDPERLPVVIYEHPALPAMQALSGDIGGLAFAMEASCPES